LAEGENMIDLDEIEKVHKGWLEARVPCSPGQWSDSTTILKLVEKIRELKRYKVAALAEMLRTRELLEEYQSTIQEALNRANEDERITVPISFIHLLRTMLDKLRSVSPQGAPAGGGEG
jgi:uncharacterized protein (UPF0305 family)